MEDITRDNVITELIALLEEAGTFTEVAEKILQVAETYLSTTNALITQISPDNTTSSSIVAYTKEGCTEITLDEVNMRHLTMCCDYERMITRESAANSELKFINLHNVMSCVVEPIRVRGVLAMHLWIIDTEGYDAVNDETIEIARSTAKILQSIIRAKVINSSLLSSYEVLTQILNNIGSGIIVCSKEDGSVLFENKMAKDTEEIRRTIKESINERFKRKPDPYNMAEEHYDAESGLWFEIKYAEIKWIDGNKVFICTATDITQRKKNQQRIEYQAHNDFLTGLYNRMKCESDLRRCIRKTVETNKKGAVFFIDLDDFKHINDGLGHQYGDILLQQIAAGMQAMPGMRGNCYRMGGDEFLILITPEMYPDLDNIIKRIIAMFNKPWYLMETEYFCTMSMGIAVFPDKGTDGNELVKKADIAMYEAKKAGKNGYAYYSDESDNNSARQLDIENNMRQAIADKCNEFIVFYQPILDAKTQKCVSCEALVRWNSRAFGFMGPGEFIPLAEYLGLITFIGDFVLEQACIQCKRWNDNGYPDLRVNVNLSVVQLLQKNVVANITKVIENTGVNPNNIVLEITESFAINDMERVMNIIKGLKKIGLKIALDDFGTGYSSLNYIKQLPLDYIKVDKTFIDDVIEDDYAQAFIKLIVDLSKTIGVKICVEGVEKTEQYELIRDLGADMIQGFYFGRPVDVKVFQNEILKKYS